MVLLVLGLILFLGIHAVSIVARPSRDRMVASMGANGWRGVYSLISAIGLGLIIWSWGDARAAAPLIYEPPVWMKHLVALLMLFAAIAIAVYMVPAGRLKPVLKHPMLLSVKIWAFAHLLANGDLASLQLTAQHGHLLFQRVQAIPVIRPIPGRELFQNCSHGILTQLLVGNQHIHSSPTFTKSIREESSFRAFRPEKGYSFGSAS